MANVALVGKSIEDALAMAVAAIAEAHQPYGEHGVLIGEIDLSRATGYLANRLRISP